MPPKKKVSGLIKLQIQAERPTPRRPWDLHWVSTASTSWNSARPTTRPRNPSAVR